MRHELPFLMAPFLVVVVIIRLFIEYSLAKSYFIQCVPPHQHRHQQIPSHAEPAGAVHTSHPS